MRLMCRESTLASTAPDSSSMAAAPHAAMPWPRLDLFPEIRGRVFGLAQRTFPFISVEHSPCRVVHEDVASGFKLLRYTFGAGRSPGGTLLVVPHFINRPYILDLYPDVSVVRHFCQRGFDVHLIDWGYPSAEHAGLSFEHYAAYVGKALNLASGKPANVLGYCTGGMVLLMYMALHPGAVRKSVLLATPVDFSTCDARTMLVRWSSALYDTPVLGNVPGEFANLLGIYLLSLYYPLFLAEEHFAHEMLSCESLRDLWRRVRWVLDAPAVPLAVYDQLVGCCYRKNLLVQNKLEVGGRRIDLGKIETPVLNVLARYDHLVPPRSAMRLRSVYRGNQYREIVFPSSHVGLSVSRIAHERLWPRVSGWLAA